MADDSIFLSNCVLAGNRSLDGSVFAIGPETQLHLLNCTITGNQKERSSGSLLFGGATTSFLSENSIIYGNEIPFGGGNNTERTQIIHSLTDTKWNGEGNISGDPKFVDPENGDFHLQRGSPCIDSGTDTGLK
ncbi:MAG: hypothetical protein KC917_23740, partial [Candidatus Omnitrophica bacterium]|nr:hypothetical protein [Candidatus Omnitrophota bacterium]